MCPQGDDHDLVFAELTRLVEPTRQEQGCIQYDLHRNNDNPGHFLFFENWETRDLWQAHMGSAHLAAFKLATVVKRLPKTRSGKILRGTMKKIADSHEYKMPATIDDPAILGEIDVALKAMGYAGGKQ